MALKSIVYSWRRNKAFLLVNFVGLSIGLMVTILLFLFAYNELNYDKWIPNSSKILRLNTLLIEPNSVQDLPVTTRLAYTELRGKISGMKDLTQLCYDWRTTDISYEEINVTEINFIYAETNFFEVFDFKILEGNKNEILASKNNIVLAKSLADKLFPNQSAIGKIVTVENREYTVSGVVRDLPKNTHFNFDAIFSVYSNEYMTNTSATSFNLFTYFIVDDQSDVKTVSKMVEEEYTKLTTSAFEKIGPYRVDGYTMPITDIYLKSKTNYELNSSGNLVTIWILISVALLILVLAITNFINLFMVQSKNRSAEIGIRKVNGASHGAITKLFFDEVGLVVLLAGIIGYSASYFLIPNFTNLVGKQVEQSLLFDFKFIAMILGVMIGTIVLSISYPSSILSRLNPVEIIKKTGSSPSKRMFSNAVVIFQSTITILLIAFVLVINKQTRYLQDLPKGLNPNNIMEFVASGPMVQHYDALCNDLLSINGIKAVSRTPHEIGNICTISPCYRYGEDPSSSKTINNYNVSPNYCEILELELLDGEFFRDNDSTNYSKIVINEAASKFFFDKGQAVGQHIILDGHDCEIIGVTKDFCYGSPGKEIKPLVLNCFYARYGMRVSIKFDESVSKQSAMNMVEPIVRGIDPTFIYNPSWLEDVFTNKFASEKQLFRIIFAGSILAIIIAVLGLVAIHSFTISSRLKEIGIRKVSGSTIAQIIALLSKNVFKQTFISSAIATPAAWILGWRWLNQYTVHTDIDFLILLVPILIQVIISLATTLYISYKAATMNPVDVLKTE